MKPPVRNTCTTVPAQLALTSFAPTGRFRRVLAAGSAISQPTSTQCQSLQHTHTHTHTHQSTSAIIDIGIYIYDNIRKVLQEVGYGYMDWIGLAQDRDRWRTLVSAVMNLRVP